MGGALKSILSVVWGLGAPHARLAALPHITPHSNTGSGRIPAREVLS